MHGDGRKIAVEESIFVMKGFDGRATRGDATFTYLRTLTKL
jgi:hypothetical protein